MRRHNKLVEKWKPAFDGWIGRAVSDAVSAPLAVAREDIRVMDHVTQPWEHYYEINNGLHACRK